MAFQTFNEWQATRSATPGSTTPAPTSDFYSGLLKLLGRTGQAGKTALKSTPIMTLLTGLEKAGELRYKPELPSIGEIAKQLPSKGREFFGRIPVVGPTIGGMAESFLRGPTALFTKKPVIEKLGDVASTVGFIKAPFAGPAFGAFSGGLKVAEQAIKGQPLGGEEVKKAYQESIPAGYQFAAISNLTAKALGPLLNKIAPTQLGNINKFINAARQAPAGTARDALINAAWKEVLKRVTKAGVTGGIGFGTVGAVQPAKDLEERFKKTVTQGLIGAVFGGGLEATGLGLQATGGQVIKPALEKISAKLKPALEKISAKLKPIPLIRQLREAEIKGDTELVRKITDQIRKEPIQPIVDTRPVHQRLIEEAFNKGDLNKAQQIIDQIPANDPYKVSMQSFLDRSKPGQVTSAKIDSTQVVIDALKEAKPIRKAQEALYTVERGKRLGEVIAVGKKVPGEAGFYKQLGELKGELPKVQYESIRTKVSQKNIDDLFQKIEDHPIVDPWDKIVAKNGLAKLFGARGGQVPTEGELGLLNDIFGKDFVVAVEAKRSLFEKATLAGEQLFNIPRSLMASSDMSFTLRQGLFLGTGFPKRFLQSFKQQFKYFGNEKAFGELEQEIRSRPTYPLMKESHLALTDIGRGLTNREEAFMSNWAEKIPFIGGIVRASERAYVGFANKLRADVFDDLVSKATDLGRNVENDPVLLASIAKFVNSASGRGSLGSLERTSVLLNTALFSPRLFASRLNLLNPVFYVKLDPFVRKEALRTLLTFGGVQATILGMAKLAGATVGADPRNADFGKIRVGNTRVDMMGGFQQYIRLAAQLISGQIVSSTTGRTITLGEGYKPLTRLDILGRFLEYKEAPILSFATDLLRGKTTLGEEIDLKSQIAKRFIPLVIQDAYNLYKEGRLERLVATPLMWFGAGVQTYGPTGREKVYQDLKKLSPKEANKQIQGYKRTDPLLYSFIISHQKDERLKVTPEEQDIRAMGVKDGTRVDRVVKKLSKLKSQEEKNKLIRRYVQVGILTDEVYRQLRSVSGKLEVTPSPTPAPAPVTSGGEGFQTFQEWSQTQTP